MKIPVAFRMDSKLKAEGERRAREERRSFTGHIEWLIAEDAKRHPAPEPQRPRRSRKGGAA